MLLAEANQWPEDAEEVVTGEGRDALRDLLPDYLQRCAWFGGGTAALPAGRALGRRAALRRALGAGLR